MGGVTTHGYPYVTATDHPKESPVPNRALAPAPDTMNMSVGGISHGSASVPSSTTGSTAFTVVGVPAVWGGMTYSSAYLYAPVNGRYRVSFQAVFPSGSGGTIRAAWVWNSGGVIPDANGQQIAAYNNPTTLTSGFGNVLTGVGVWTLSVGENVRIYLRQDSGSTLSVTGTLAVELIRAT